MPDQEKRIYEFGEFRLDVGEHLLLRGETERINLSPRTFTLLVKLIENAGHLLTKEELMKEVWSDAVVEEGNLNRTVSNLRKSLGEKPNEKRFIETVPRIGYRFIAPVLLVNEKSEIKQERREEGREFSTNELTEEKEIPHTEKEIVENQKSKTVFLIVALVLTLLLALGFIAWRSRQKLLDFKISKSDSSEAIRLTDAPEDDSHPHWTPDGRIRFFRIDANRQTESLIMNADGSEQTFVKNFPAMKYAVFSPDEQKVIFAKPNDKTAYYLANADGSNETVLPFYAGNFDWSSDAKFIVYQKPVTEIDSEIFIYSLETGESKNISNNAAFDADPSFSSDGKKIVFISGRDGNSEIYTMNAADGSEVRRLTNHPSSESHPVFSPDGTQIAFTSDREAENADVYLVNADGSGAVKRLTTWTTNETVEPGCWSPDGTRIAFFSDHADGKTDDIYVISAEVSKPQKLPITINQNIGFPSYSPDGKKILYQAEAGNKTGEIRIFDLETKSDNIIFRTETADIAPLFSFDGKQIVFQNKIGENTEICLINADGSSPVNLTNNAAKDVSPTWSPDGKQIVFVSNRDGNFALFQIYVMNADGTNQHRIYSSGGISASPVWSPDGREIIFTNDKEDGRTGNFEIFTIEPETAEPEKRLTFRRHYDVAPAVSPDGKQVVFVSETDGNPEIYLMKRDGTSILRLTRNQAEDVNPRFSPDGRKIIFSSNRDGNFAIYEMQNF